MRLTRRGFGMIAAAVTLFAAGEALGYPVLRVLAGAAAAVVLAGWVTAGRRIRIEVNRSVYPDRVSCDTLAVATLQLRNPGTRTSAAFTARDVWSGGGCEPVTIRRLPAGETAVHEYDVPTWRRGRLELGPLTAERTDPLGLARARATAGRTSTVWVHPRTYPVRILLGGFPRHHHDGLVTEPPMRGTLDLRAVREYVPGDERRLVHWRASARTGTLMVRDYADPAQPRFTVLLDVRADAMDPARFESAVEVAASLARASAAAGHRTRLLTTAGNETETTGGRVGERELLDCLCEVGQRADCPDAGALPGRIGSGGCLVYVSGGRRAADGALLGAARKGFGRLAVFDMAPDMGSPGQLAGALVFRPADGPAGAAAWNAAVGR